jgi:A/G-specific adenine glycosylase
MGWYTAHRGLQSICSPVGGSLSYSRAGVLYSLGSRSVFAGHERVFVIDRKFFVNWYNKHGRDLPWRKEDVSPFKVLITEMLLRQTHVANVIKVWEQFTSSYPTPLDILEASDEELAGHLHLLGLVNQRVEALKAAAGWLVEHHSGQVPETLEELKAIPHVGIYAAGAVLAFAFRQRSAIVDTNIQRVYARYYGMEVKPDVRRNPHVWELAREHLPPVDGDVPAHHYGLLDFSAQVCTARSPRCEACPLVASCDYGRFKVESIEQP